MAIAERELLSPITLPALVSEEEYLAREASANEKSEYIHGRIEIMSGGTDAHGALAVWVASALVIALKGRGCWIMSSDVKVYAAGSLYYPDVSVTCGPRRYHSANRTVIANPVLLVEVLSPSTGAKDRGEKFLDYQQIDSLNSYLLVSQDEARIELFTRGEDGHWDYSQAHGLECALPIPALSISLALADIYAQIDFSEAEIE